MKKSEPMASSSIIHTTQNQVDNLFIKTELLPLITEQHKKVSRIETPKAFIKKKQGWDYVDV